MGVQTISLTLHSYSGGAVFAGYITEKTEQ